MNTTNCGPASLSAVQAAPKPDAKVDSIHIRVVGNGYIVNVHTDDYCEKQTVHISAESALKRVTEALIPMPKPTRKAKKAAA